MRALPWPGTLAGRTFLVLLLGLLTAQLVGLAIHGLDRVDALRVQQLRDGAERVGTLWRIAVTTPAAERAAALREAELPAGMSVSVDAAARVTSVPAPAFAERGARFGPMRAPPHLRPREVLTSGTDPPGGVMLALRLPDGMWLNIAARPPRPRFWHGPTFLAAFAVMSLAVALLSFWAVRRLTRPVAQLAAAADRLGRDVNAPPLPEDGPREVRQAAASFNTMAARIKRFVADRTTMLAAIGHDLRTPITRMKLRAEFIEDPELRGKMLADLDGMERMIAATMAFARDDAAAEKPAPLDLAALLRTIADEANDVAGGEVAVVEGAQHLVLAARPVALKRALANLVGNAVAHAGACRIRLAPAEAGLVRIAIEDEGPGIPDSELERMFLPFQRLDPARSPGTGGIGLGLPIARNILRAHGGDVVLANRLPRGLAATVTLPA